MGGWGQKNWGPGRSMLVFGSFNVGESWVYVLGHHLLSMLKGYKKSEDFIPHP